MRLSAIAQHIGSSRRRAARDRARPIVVVDIVTVEVGENALARRDMCAARTAVVAGVGLALATRSSSSSAMNGSRHHLQIVLMVGDGVCGSARRLPVGCKVIGARDVILRDGRQAGALAGGLLDLVDMFGQWSSGRGGSRGLFALTTVSQASVFGAWHAVRCEFDGLLWSIGGCRCCSPRRWRGRRTFELCR
jgi:hypothetical protein